MSEIELDTDLNELIKKLIDGVPEGFRPIAIQYAPVIATWSQAQIWAWIELVATNQDEAYRGLLAGLDTSAAYLAEWDARIDAMAELNISAAASAEVAKEAAAAILKVVLAMALTMVGL